jgi:hypothetical protein
MRIIGVAALTGILIGCGSDSGTGPKYPDMAGTYRSQELDNFDNLAETQNGQVLADLTVTFTSAGSSGQFTGSYTYSRWLVGSGLLSGVERSDGTFTLTQFGSSTVNAPVQTLQILYPNCDFSTLSTPGLSGAVHDRTFSMTGFYDFKCSYVENGAPVTLPTVYNVAVSGDLQ